MPRPLLFVTAAVLLIAAALLHAAGRVALVRTELASGPALFLSLAFLAAYGIRRQLAPLRASI